MKNEAAYKVAWWSFLGEEDISTQGKGKKNYEYCKMVILQKRKKRVWDGFFQ